MRQGMRGGGSALRFLFGLPRFSEDLDFALERPDRSGFDLAKVGARVTAQLSREVERRARADRLDDAGPQRHHMEDGGPRPPGIHELGRCGARRRSLSRARSRRQPVRAGEPARAIGVLATAAVKLLAPPTSCRTIWYARFGPGPTRAPGAGPCDSYRCRLLRRTETAYLCGCARSASRAANDCRGRGMGVQSGGNPFRS